MLRAPPLELNEELAKQFTAHSGRRVLPDLADIPGRYLPEERLVLGLWSDNDAKELSKLQARLRLPALYSDPGPANQLRMREELLET